MSTERETFGSTQKNIQVAEWYSPIIEEARYIGFQPDQWSRTGRAVLSLGRTPEEAILLSRNKLSIRGVWRLADYIKQNG